MASNNGQHIAGYATFTGDVFCVECVADMVRGGEWGEDTAYDAREGVGVIRDAEGFAPLLDVEGEYVRPVRDCPSDDARWRLCSPPRNSGLLAITGR